ncbi:MAG TPA: ATP-binding cassette domain-containing protein [Anaerolineae bacterium]|nr:ATP-binding cassette domain-containing protein [Anaerolineae bacterium]
MTTPLYTLTHIQQQYDQRLILDIDTLTIHTGEILALVGPSGAGKSTLLRLLAFLETATHGQIEYQGTPLHPPIPLHYRHQITMVFQKPQLLRRSVRDNVNLGLQLRHQSNPARVTTVLDSLGLLDLANQTATKLSGGEAQRVALARALVLQPQLLLLDEPTANLDPYNIRLIENIVLQANQNWGTTVVIVTHNIFQARRLAHRVGLLLNGRLHEVAPTEQFFTNPQHPETSAFVNGDILY